MRATTIMGMLVFAALTRVLPHPPNFAPIAAIALFGAMTFKSAKVALLFPMAAMLLSDIAIEVAYRSGMSESWGFHKGMWVIYALMAFIGALGLAFKDTNPKFTKIGALSLTSSIMFFVISNFAVWAGSGMYSRDTVGLTECYVAAIPFFYWTVLGDLCYTMTLFSAWAVVQNRIPALRLNQTTRFGTI